MEVEKQFKQCLICGAQVVPTTDRMEDKHLVKNFLELFENESLEGLEGNPCGASGLMLCEKCKSNVADAKMAIEAAILVDGRAQEGLNKLTKDIDDLNLLTDWALLSFQTISNSIRDNGKQSQAEGGGGFACLLQSRIHQASGTLGQLQKSIKEKKLLLEVFHRNTSGSDLNNAACASPGQAIDLTMYGSKSSDADEIASSSRMNVKKAAFSCPENETPSPSGVPRTTDSDV